jgi:glycosyltransferase involved in cell wall biosynthesis
MHRPRIAILHQGCVPTYRRAFFEQLGAIASRRYVVFHGDPEPVGGIGAARPPFAFEHVEVRNRFYRVLGRTLIYQPVFSKITFGDFDALVIGHEVKFVANIALALQFRTLGKPVLLWGFGRNVDVLLQFRSPLGRAFGRVISRGQNLMLDMATDYLAYTQTGAEHAKKAGIRADRVTVLNNTIDLSGEIAAHARAQSLDRGELRRELGLSTEAVAFLFVGRLIAAKRVDALIEAVQKLRRQSQVPAEVLIVGSGPEEAQLKSQANGAAWCHFLGEQYEADSLAKIFRACDAMVIPGYVGLAVNHAFAHGLPVVTCQSETHSPEIEYIEDSVNGFILPSLADLASGLLHFASSGELRRNLAAQALASRNKLELQHMVQAFDEGVRRAIDRYPARRWRERHLPKTR